MADNVTSTGDAHLKYGARHSAKDQELLHGIRQKAREIDQAAVDLGAVAEEIAEQEQAEQPGKADVTLTTAQPLIWGVVKAAGDWQLDVLGIPYGDAANRDADGEWFDAKTELHPDKWTLPPAVYYHGFGPDKKPMGDPEYIGKTVRRWVDAAGVWYRVVLDKASSLAKRVWDAAQAGVARASSGSIAHLTRVDSDGHIREWPVVELSVFDATEGREPANRYAVAIPVAKAIYDRAGLAFQAPGAEPEAGDPAATAAHTIAQNGSKEMEASEIQKIVADALKARDDEAAAVAARKAETDAAVAAALKARDEQDAASGRLVVGAPHIRKYSAKWDNLTPAEHALVIGILASSGTAKKRAPSDEFVRALALKIESEAARNASAAEAYGALKAMGLKANEVMYSTLSSHGDEWIGVQYSNQIWEQIRAECWVLNKLAPYSDQIGDGYESEVVPLESTDPTWYKVAQATAHTSGRPDVTVTSSQLTTGQKAVTLAKMGCRVTYSGELSEDSLVPIAPQIMRQMKQSGLEQFEHAIIDGDTDETITTNVNDIGGTPAGTEVFCLVNGFRKLALVTNTANSRSGGALGDEDFLETAKLLGTVGINADITKVSFISDHNTYWKAMQMANVMTRDVFVNATLEKGQLQGIWGFEYKPSAFMHYMSSARKANTAGKVDQDTTANNTTGAILAVRWDQWRLKWKRRMTLETDRWPESDTNQIVAMTRWGLGYRDTEASAITYGITGV